MATIENYLPPNSEEDIISTTNHKIELHLLKEHSNTKSNESNNNSNSEEELELLEVTSADSDLDYGSELFLTPLLQNGQLTEARTKAKVENLSQIIESYSGFFTVNEEYGSNMFFWFFPALYHREDAPLLIWLQGGPGSSSLIGLFNENGPFRIDVTGNLKYREVGSWALTNSVLYIDNPVGSGFSYTENDKGYAKCQDDVSNNLYEVLLQFYQLFPEFQQNELYLTGQSYAGKYIPHFACKIHKRNHQPSSKTRINLKGCIIGSTFTDPFIQLDWGEYLYNMGLCSEDERAIFDRNTQKMKGFIKNEQWFDAFKILQTDMFAFPPSPIPTTFETSTGLTNTCCLLEQDYAPCCLYYRKFLKNSSTRRSIHVGKRCLNNFGETKSIVFMKLAEDMPKSEKKNLEFLLNEGYSILLYSSQFDIVVPHTAIDKLLKALDWVHCNEFKNIPREIWRFNDKETAGYKKEYKNLSYYFIRNAGHMAPTNQPEWCFDMITKFLTRNKLKDF